MRNKLWCLFRTNILICSTKTPQLCYKLESSSLRSIRFLLGLWYLSWRPWWWESTVNRLSFYPELLLYKMIIDSEKKILAGALLCLGSIGKTVRQQLLLKTWPSYWNAISQAPQQTTTAYFAATMPARFFTYLADRWGTMWWQERWQVI